MKTLFIILILASNALAFEFANDAWYANDKLAHGAGSYCLTDVIDSMTPLNAWQSALAVNAAGVLWEIQTSAIRWETVGTDMASMMDSTDPFSYRDLAWNLLGTLTYCAKDVLKNNLVQISVCKKTVTLDFQIRF